MISHTAVRITESVFAHDQPWAKDFMITTTVLSFTRAQKVVRHIVVHYRIGVYTWPRPWEEQTT